MKRYKLGVIGAGARGETFARQLHATTPRAELYGICDLDAERLETFCSYCELDGAARFTDPDEFLAGKDLDGIIITTPEWTHAPIAVAAMRAGKHVYLEKPLAHTIEDCLAIKQAREETGCVAYVGFNVRATPARAKLKDVINSGVLGQVVNIDGIEQLAAPHGAAYMRRFHRKSSQSGGLINHKGSHDLDILLWMAGHKNHVRRIASFGGCNVLTPDKQPATHCRDCPVDIWQNCRYKAVPGYAFPIHADKPAYHSQSEIYGGDLCVYNAEKDLVDNQTVIFEWDNGVRGSYNMQMFQSSGLRRNRVVGELGLLELNSIALTDHGGMREVVTVTDGRTGDVTEYRFNTRKGGHGGSDPLMIQRFVEAIDTGDARDSGLEAGIAATVVALKAEEARLSGQVVEIDPELFG